MQDIAMVGYPSQFDPSASITESNTGMLAGRLLAPVGGRTVFTRSRVAILLTAALIALAGFVAGFRVCLHLKGTYPAVSREQELVQPVNTPPEVRAGILERLHALQQGYIQRDPKQIDSFTRDLFAADGDVLILGTEGGTEEWVRGSSAARKFIADDWRGWGDLNLDVDHAIVWSSGSAGWVATLGTVDWQQRKRPVRFTAVLTLEHNRWVFRQMHFQWDDQDPTVSDLLRTHTYLSLIQGANR